MERPIGLQILIFEAAGAKYSIYSEHITELAPPLPIVNVPWTGQHVLGVANLRGNIISVVDIGFLLSGKKMLRTRDSRIVVCRVGELAAGLLVETISEIIPAGNVNIEPALSTISSEKEQYIEGEFEHRGGIVPLLNMEKVRDRLLQDQHGANAGRLKSGGV